MRAIDQFTSASRIVLRFVLGVLRARSCSGLEKFKPKSNQIGTWCSSARVGYGVAKQVSGRCYEISSRFALPQVRRSAMSGVCRHSDVVNVKEFAISCGVSIQTRVRFASRGFSG